MRAAVVRHAEIVRAVPLAWDGQGKPLQLRDVGRQGRMFTPDTATETVRVTEGPQGRRVTYDIEVTGCYVDARETDGRGTWRHGALQRVEHVEIPEPIRRHLLGAIDLEDAEATR